MTRDVGEGSGVGEDGLGATSTSHLDLLQFRVLKILVGSGLPEPLPFRDIVISVPGGEMESSASVEEIERSPITNILKELL